MIKDASLKVTISKMFFAGPTYCFWNDKKGFTIYKLCGLELCERQRVCFVVFELY